MKDLKNLKGAITISKSEQQAIKGGIVRVFCNSENPCPNDGLCAMMSIDVGYCVFI
ncbi:MAG: hypothetical protein GQ557_01500 [Mycoplasmataceae bacterium]|nr:hypothetical protein [Mycoplasmataceae bacterium]